MKDKPFSLDKLGDLPRYVSKASHQTVLDDKSGYDHLFLTDDSTFFFGIQWGGSDGFSRIIPCRSAGNAPLTFTTILVLWL